MNLTHTHTYIHTRNRLFVCKIVSCVSVINMPTLWTCAMCMYFMCKRNILQYTNIITAHTYIQAQKTIKYRISIISKQVSNDRSSILCMKCWCGRSKHLCMDGSQLVKQHRECWSLLSILLPTLHHHIIQHKRAVWRTFHQLKSFFQECLCNFHWWLIRIWFCVKQVTLLVNDKTIRITKTKTKTTTRTPAT